MGMAAAGRLYTPPDIIKRQAMRANLLAKATATNFGGFRSSSEAEYFDDIQDVKVTKDMPKRIVISSLPVPVLRITGAG